MTRSLPPYFSYLVQRVVDCSDQNQLGIVCSWHPIKQCFSFNIKALNP